MNGMDRCGSSNRNRSSDLLYGNSSAIINCAYCNEEIDSEGDYAGEWFRIANYPSSDEIRNGANVDANRQLPTASVWWDQ